MATDASVVARVVRNIRKVCYLFPIISWNFVAGVAGPLVLSG